MPTTRTPVPPESATSMAASMRSRSICRSIIGSSCSRAASAKTPFRVWGFTAALLLVLLGVVLHLSRTVSVGFYLEPHPGGSIVAVETTRDGGSRQSHPQATDGSYVAFPIRTSVEHFHFEFSPSPHPYMIRSVSLHAMPLFNSNWLFEKVNPSMRLYDMACLQRGESLPLRITDEVTTVDYVRFFDAILSLFRVVSWGAVASMCLVVALTALWVARLYRPDVWAAAKVRLGYVRAASETQWAFVACVVAATLLALPPPVIPVSPGLDPSWMWLLNQLAFTKAMGVSTVFTYGPLGFVCFPQAMGSNVEWALALNTTCFAAWAGMLLHLYSQPAVDKRGLWCLLACVLIPTRTLEWQWTLLPIMLMACAVLHSGMSRRAAIAYSALSGAFLVVVSMIKFTSLVAGASSMALGIVGLLASDRRKARDVAAAAVMAVAVVSLIAVHGLFESAGAAITWFMDSLQIASGYNASMLANKSWGELVAPFAYVGATVGYLLVGKGMATATRLRVLYFAPLYFVLTKYAITRQNMHPMLFAGPATIALLLAFAGRDMRSRCLAVFRVQMAYALIVGLLLVPSGLLPGRNVVALSFANLRSTLFLRRSIDAAQRESERLLAPAQLPREWLLRMGTNTVQSLPHELSYIAAHRLNTVPLYAFQGYCAFTRSLDQKSASLYRQAGAPRYILCEWFALDGRNMFLESPSLWSEVLATYKRVDHTDKLVLLERRIDEAKPIAPLLGTRRVAQGEWVDGETLPGRRIRVEWPYTFVGRLGSLFLRNDMTFLSVEHADGIVRTYRVLPDTLRSWFDLDGIPRDWADVVSVLNGTPDSGMQAKRIRFTSNHGFCYSRTLTLYY